MMLFVVASSSSQSTAVGREREMGGLAIIVQDHNDWMFRATQTLCLPPTGHLEI